ncbi:MAG: hypothetical protein ACK5P1_12030 [Sphingobacteriia bacterium]
MKIIKLSIILYSLYKLGILSEEFLISMPKIYSKLISLGKAFISKKKSDNSYISVSLDENLPIDIRIAKKNGFKIPKWLANTLAILGLEQVNKKQINKLIKNLMESVIHPQDQSDPKLDTKLINSLLKDLEILNKQKEQENYDDEDDDED